MSALSFQSVSKIYPAKSQGGAALKALDQVSFDIEEGEFLACSGPMGQAKPP